MTSKRCLFLALLLIQVAGECENACSGHGQCTAFDMCLCFRNWQGNDCSERICEFAPAFVDTPKGDLDSSNSIEGPDEILVENSITYPYGTSEQFPATINSDLQPVHQSAHDYAECSNAGLCNRTTGVCNCFDGFTGAACQRMTCPGSDEGIECNGHGTCQTLRRMADLDYKGTYNLWSKNMVQACVCDTGYFGADCAQRNCPFGVDPLYLDDISTIQVPSYFLTVLTTSDYYDFTDGFAQPSAGTYRLKIYDKNRQGYLSSPIRAGASCAEIVLAMEETPGRILPRGKTNCLEVQFTDKNPLSQNSSWRIKYNALYQYYFDGTKSYEISSRPAIDAFGYENSAARNKSADVLLSGNLYFFQFFGNIGDFLQPEINTHMFDGMSSSLQSSNGQVVARIWTNGMQGNNIDYFADRCEGVKAQVKQSDGEGFLWGKFLSDEFLADCLGRYRNGDRGTMYKPHLIKLVRTVADQRDGSFMAAVFFDTTSDFVAGAGERSDAEPRKGAWRLLNPLYSLDNDEAIYDVFASHGTLTVTDNRAGVAFSFGSNRLHTYNTSFDLGQTSYDGDISCDKYQTPSGQTNDHRACLDKGDLFVLVNPYNGADNPPFLNLYTARTVQRLPSHKLLGPSSRFIEDYDAATDLQVNLTSVFLVTADMNINWASTQVGPSVFHVYKFVPNVTHSYQYVSQCANRGLCNHFEGTCECFAGYAGPACADQSTVIT